MHCRGKYVEVKPYEKVVFTWGGVADLKPGESTVEITDERQLEVPFSDN